MAARVFLALNAIVWLPYGLFLFFQPGYLAEAAGVSAATTTASIELRAMYGGLQAGIGVLTGLAVFRAELRRPALLMLVFLASGLGIARLLGAAIDAEVSAYTGVALAFEFAIAGLSVALLRSGDAAVAV